jgi:hypothetical protein
MVITSHLQRRAESDGNATMRFAQENTRSRHARFWRELARLITFFGLCSIESFPGIEISRIL